jgi:hypothetical protein
MMAEQKETVGLNPGGGDQGSNQYGSWEGGSGVRETPVPTLAEVGIDKNLANRASHRGSHRGGVGHQENLSKKTGVQSRSGDGGQGEVAGGPGLQHCTDPCCAL